MLLYTYAEAAKTGKEIILTSGSINKQYRLIENKFIPVERKYIIAHTPDYHSTNFVCFRTDQEIMGDKYDHDEIKRILSLNLNEGRQIAYGVYCLRIQ